MLGRVRRTHFHTDPALPHTAVRAEIVQDFFRSLDGQRKDAAVPVHHADEHADGLAAEVHDGRAALAALHGEVCADVARGKKAALDARADVQPGDEPEARRERQIERVAEGDDGRGEREVGGFPEFQKPHGPLGDDLQDGDADARVGDDPRGGIALFADGDGDVLRGAADAVGREQRAVGINEKPRAAQAPVLVVGLDAADGVAGLARDFADFAREHVGLQGRGLCGLRDPRGRGLLARWLCGVRVRQRGECDDCDRGGAKSESASFHS